MKIFYLTVLLVLVILGAGFWFYLDADQLPQKTTDERIRVASPRPGQAIASPVVITGEARGTWYFEATFPVVLVNWDGLIIAEGYAEAESDWMTEEFVPFKATLEFTKPEYGERGALILQRSNASGLPEHDAAVEIPIVFK